jgi:hypothetical protein
MVDAMLVVANIGADLRFGINPCSDIGGNFREGESDDGRGPAGEGQQIATGGRAPGTSGGPASTDAGAANPARGRGDGEAEFDSALVALGRDGEHEEVARLRLDVVAVRADDPEHLAQIASAYLLELSDPSDPQAILEGWRIASVPRAARSEIALSSLAVLLAGDGVDCAGIVQRLDESLLAVTAQVEAQRRTSIPASWVERVLEANFAGVPYAAESGVYSFDLGDAFVPEVTRFTGALARRKEFAAVHAVTVLLEAAPDSGGGAAPPTIAETQPAAGGVSP